MSPSNQKPSSYVFVLSTGRSGTGYLAHLLAANLTDSQCAHEIIGPGHFGVDTPDLSHLTLFNTAGNVEHVQAFWRNKFAKLAHQQCSIYAETSHIIAKAGLAENLHMLGAEKIVLIDLRRDLVSTLKSFAARRDFLSNGNAIMWYLDNSYSKNLYRVPQVRSHGHMMAWYVTEMRCRGAYYRAYFERDPSVQVIRTDLEDIVTKVGATAFFDALGFPLRSPDIVLPARVNESKTANAFSPEAESFLRQAADLVSHVDADQIGRRTFEEGLRFSPA